MLQLKDQGIFAVGTLRQDRSRGCKLPTEKEIKNSGRGTIPQFTEKNGLVLCVWFDNHRIITISNFIGKDTISSAKRYDGKEKKMVQIQRPSSVEIYNRFIGGVDKADMLLSLYGTKLRSRKWCHRIVFHLVSLALIYSFTVYRQTGGKGSLLEFQIEISRCLLKADKEVDSDEDMENPPRFQRSLKAKQTPDQVRNDGVNH